MTRDYYYNIICNCTTVASCIHTFIPVLFFYAYKCSLYYVLCVIFCTITATFLFFALKKILTLVPHNLFQLIDFTHFSLNRSLFAYRLLTFNNYHLSELPFKIINQSTVLCNSLSAIIYFHFHSI